MKWISCLLLILSLNLKAETATSPASNELTVSGSDSAVVTANGTTEAVLAEPKVSIKESEIPVNLEAAKKTAASDNPLMKIIMTLSVVGILGSAAYFFIRKYMRSGIAKTSANQVKVLSQHYLGPKKSLAIIRVAGESILIGITDHNISLIKELSLLDDEIPETTPKKFAPIFQQANSAQFAEEEDGRDEFSISGIKDFVSTKLKNMRTLE